MSTNETETAPLLQNHELQPLTSEEIAKKKFTFLIGGLLGILSSLTFACNNYAIKKWQLDFVDILLVRSCVQIVIFGIFAKSFHEKFWPVKEDHESFKTYWIRCLVLVFQVGTNTRDFNENLKRT